MPTIRDIRPGDTVTIGSSHGGRYSEKTGRCVMAFPTHAVLNIGGRHGTPAVATADAIIGIKRAKRKA